jgi:ferredoxin-NADP reductase
MNVIDALLNRITMYRLVVYGLGIVAVTGILFASIGRLSMSPVAMIITLALLCLCCYSIEYIYAKIWRTPFNSESWLITALIIFLIIPPAKDVNDAIATILIGTIASLSKYLIAWNGKHIFNPAAFAVAAAGIMNIQITNWWVGNSAMWLLTLVFGLLVVRKIKKFQLVLAFVLIALLVQLLLFAVQGQLLLTTITSALIASPLIFLSTIMLTEPATMPPRRNQQFVFAAIAAVLYVSAWRIGPVTIYPEIALLIANVYAFAISPKFKVKMQLKEIHKISDKVWDYVFVPSKRFDFKAGQYMEWTLPGVSFDSRGNRRSFTIASSPTEDEVHVGVKFYDPTSMYKYTMSRMEPGDEIYASQLSGDFTLDASQDEKLVFIAGGIGITPFRSMIMYLLETDQKRDIILLYAVSNPDELAYIDELKVAQQIGLRVIPILTDLERHASGFVTSKVDVTLIEKVVADHSERTFYISGPNAMVDATRGILKQLHVEQAHIKTDHFTGY